MKAGKLCQYIKLRRVHRNLTATPDDLLGLALHVFHLHQHGNGNAARVQGAFYDLGAFRNKDPLVRLVPV